MDNARRPPATRSTGVMAASTTSPLHGGIQHSEAAGAVHQRFGDTSALGMTVDCST